MNGDSFDDQRLCRLKEAFRELKAEQDSLLTNSDADAFVQTAAYKQAQDSGRCLIVGRKGSGKTALIVGHTAKHGAEYIASASFEIRADDFPLEPLFAFFYTDYQRGADAIRKGYPPSSDLRSFLTPARVAALAWREALKAAATYVAAMQLLPDALQYDTEQTSALANAIDLIAQRAGLGSSAKISTPGSAAFYALIVYHFTDLQQRINNAIDRGSQDLPTLLAEITNVVSVATSERSRVIDDAASNICEELQYRQKKVLISLDKFDDFFDQFYKTKTKDSSERHDFLIELLEGLIIAVRELKQDANLDWLHMLLTIPLDKFVELHLRERAAIEHGHVLRLEWSPSELFDFVNRRLAVALNLDTAERSSAWDQLFPFVVANRRLPEVKEHSFLYILRHSLWKPRELQMYLHAIFSEMERTKKAPDEKLFRDVVSRATSEVVRREFLEEFGGEYTGLRDLFQHLENRQLSSTMTYEDFCDQISGSRLLPNLTSAADIVLRLYQMGLIGVRQTVPASRKFGLEPSIVQGRENIVYRFSYNSLVTDPFAAHPGSTKVVIHPMFFEFLNVSHHEGYVINQLSWEMFGNQVT